MFQAPISAGTGSSLVIPAHNYRFYLHIRNYTASAQTIWVSFGIPATPGTNGELEIVPGSEYIWGNLDYGTTNYESHGCPTDAIYVITSASTATGCILYNKIN